MALMGFNEAVKLLKKNGVKFAEFGIARNKSEAVTLAKDIGFPLVMKMISPDIVHKTDAKVVKTHIGDESEVSKAFDEIQKNAGKAHFEGMLIQKQAGGSEIIIGAKRDPQFGPVVLFGLGGVFVEIMKDVAMRVAPVDKKAALEMMREIKGWPVLAGARGTKPADVECIAEAIVAVSKLISDNEKITELDVNPLFADERGCLAVDVRIMVS